MLLAVVVCSVGDGDVSIGETMFEFTDTAVVVVVGNKSLDAVICAELSTVCGFSVDTDFTEQGEVTCECKLEGEELSPSLPLVFCNKDTIVDERLLSNTF